MPNVLHPQEQIMMKLRLLLLRADFTNKMKISLREMRESNYWMRICIATKFGNQIEAVRLQQESAELKNILGSICSKL